MVQLDATVDDGQMARMYQTQNLSQTGMLLRTRQPLPVGTDVAVQFLFPGDPMLSRASLPGGYGFIEGEAQVVRHTHPAKERVKGMALEFKALDPSGKKQLSDFLLTQQLRGNLQTT
jgi:c-di-GMP-binding flagellar brake protein YcgR